MGHTHPSPLRDGGVLCPSALDMLSLSHRQPRLPSLPGCCCHRALMLYVLGLLGNAVVLTVSPPIGHLQADLFLFPGNLQRAL